MTEAQVLCLNKATFERELYDNLSAFISCVQDVETQSSLALRQPMLRMTCQDNCRLFNKYKDILPISFMMGHWVEAGERLGAIQHLGLVAENLFFRNAQWIVKDRSKLISDEVGIIRHFY